MKKYVGVVGIILMAAAAVGVSRYVSAQTGQPEFASEEYLLLGDANHGGSEPQIAVSPKDPRNIVVTATAVNYDINDANFRLVPNATIHLMAVTQDDGKHWKFSQAPDHVPGKVNRGADPVAGAGPDGTLYAGGDMRYTTGTAASGISSSGLIVSTDRGDTWGPPIFVIGNHPEDRPFAPGLNPVRDESSSPWDRPFMRIDQSNGALYFVAHGGRTTDPPLTPGQPNRPQTYFVSTRDRGKTLSMVYAMDSKDYPQMSRGTIDASHGVVVTMYIAASAPGARCPCVVFGSSKDDGRTFTWQVVPSLPAPPPATGRGGAGGADSFTIIADQARTGTYVARRTVDNRIETWRSEDGGKTWTGPVVAAKVPTGATLRLSQWKYSPDGVLGLVWSSINPDRTIDMWSSISKDGGKTYSAPLKVNHSPSPPPPAYRNQPTADNVDIAIGGGFTHMVWDDSRSGIQGAWYGRVPLSKYTP